MKVAVSVCVVLSLVTGSWSFSTGAPVQACAKLAPMHANTSPQTTPSPYKITVTPANGGDLKWAPGSTLNVTISGGTINGFILQALYKAGNGLGSFSKDHMPTGTQRSPCTADDGTTPMSVTHTSPADKQDLMFVWSAPADGVNPGDIYFKGAVAQSHDIYWIDIKSSDIPGAGSRSAPAITILISTLLVSAKSLF